MRDKEDDEDEMIFRQGRQSVSARKLTPKQAAKSRGTTDRFVKVPIWWAAAAAKATRNPRFLVCIELLHYAWKANSLTFSFPNGRLVKSGANRWAKRGVLRDLEAAKLITIEWRRGKSPRVTLVLI